MRFLQSRCVTYGVGGKLNFDFQQLEQQLRRELARPEITMELRGFHWLGESVGGGGSELRQVIKQKDILPDVIERLKKELGSPTVANGCLQKVQMSVSFILKSGGGLSDERAGEMLLSEYMRTVLSESPDSLPSATARSEIQLWHVDALSKVLKQIINKDPMESIALKYRTDLPTELAEALAVAKVDLPEALLELFANTAEGRLSEEFIGDTVPMLEMLKMVMDDDGTPPDTVMEVEKHLPKGLLMKHWAATYKALKQENKVAC